jgi:hypothetical protein
VLAPDGECSVSGVFPRWVLPPEHLFPLRSTAPLLVLASIYARHRPQRAMSLQPREDHSLRYPIRHLFKVRALRLSRALGLCSIPSAYLLPWCTS